jgi:hypothetical protein
MEIPQAMSFDDIDPSLALGFLCSSQAEFDDFCLNAVAVPPSCPFPAHSVLGQAKARLLSAAARV